MALRVSFHLRWKWRVAACAVALAAVCAGGAVAVAGGASARAGFGAHAKAVQRAYGRLPVGFELNRGQSDRRVRFLAHGPGFALFLTGRGAVLSLRGHPLWMEFVGGAMPGPVRGERRLPGHVNYLVGSRRAGWHTNVPTFGAVRFSHPWPGIDVRFTGSQRQLEYSFELGVGADPGRVMLRFRGARSLALDSSGGLELALPGGVLHESPPRSYQLVGGRRRAIGSRYVLLGAGRVGIRLGRYDRRLPLVIDPALSYSTYLGGSGYDTGNAIAVDSAGSAYVTGYTNSTDFPTHNAQQPTFGGNADAYVAKLNADGSALVYATYLGGTGSDVGNGIAVDPAGNAYVTGQARSTDFPTQNPLQATYGGNGDAFVAKLSADGSALTYSTYLGGTGADIGNGIAVDSGGNAYVTGEADSSDFPTHNPLQASSGGGADAFVAKLTADGSALAYSTYLGGSSRDLGVGIAVDSAGDAYVTGEADSSNFPTHNPMQASSGGGSDAFVAKLTADGSTLTYSTYLGGSGSDSGGAIAVDSAGNPYVTGTTDSTNFPTHNPLQAAPGGGADAFVAKLTADGSALAYSTHLGGSAYDVGYGIAVDSAGDAYAVGTTSSTNFPTHNPVQPTNGGGSNDAFVAKLITPPVNGVPPAISGTARQDQTVSCSQGTWEYSPTSYAYQWNRNGSPIGAASAASYTLTSADVGRPITCTVTATNASGSTPATSTAVTPTIAPPVNSLAPAISGTAQQGHTLSCSRGTWRNSPTAYAYQWNRNGSPIGAASAASYTLTSADVRRSITCTVTATNATAGTAATSTAITPAAAAPRPALTAIRESAKTWREGQALVHIARQRKPPVGTTFSFTLNEAAKVRFAFTEAASGRMVNGKCVAPTKANKRRLKCTRTLTVATISFAGRKGTNKVRFQGRISRSKRLAPGPYTLVITATNTASQNSAPKKLTFTIVKG